MRRYATWAAVTAALLLATGFPLFVAEGAARWYVPVIVACAAFFGLACVLPAYAFEELSAWRARRRRAS